MGSFSQVPISMKVVGYESMLLFGGAVETSSNDPVILLKRPHIS